MGDVSPSIAPRRSVGNMAVERLLAAIGYPERMSGDSAPFVLRVDGAEIAVEETNGRIVLSYVLSDDQGLFPTLASYAAGRIMREDAVLTCDKSSAFLWQDAPASSREREMVRLFETFVDSCDWWRERVDALRGGDDASNAPDDAMVIRP